MYCVSEYLYSRESIWKALCLENKESEPLARTRNVAHDTNLLGT